ncbi:MAG: DUF2341 domain-containing protein, partial [Verrucomicrobiota bacterium]
MNKNDRVRILLFFLFWPFIAQALNPAEFTFRRKINFSNYDRVQTLTNFPVLVRFDPTLTNVYSGMASPTGGDLRFTDAGLINELNFEIDTWNPAGQSFVWVQVPALSSNDCIIAYWGNPTDTNLPAYAVDGSTWSEGFVAVHHLSESNGTSAGDSTANTLDGNLVNMAGTEWETGNTGNGLRFDGTDDHYTMAHISALFPANAATMNVWVKLDVATPVANNTGFM